MMYVSQINMLYTLNLYSAVCQLYLNKTGGEKKESMFKINVVILSQGHNKTLSLIKESILQNYQTWYCQYILF